MRVDVHAHFFPPEYFREVFGRSRADLVMQDEEGKEVLFGLTEPSWDLDLRLSHMEEAGVRAQVLSLTSPNVYFPDEAKSCDLAVLCNDAYAEICRKNPGRFFFFASVPLVSAQKAVDELHRAAALPGMKGVMLGTNVLDRPLSSPEFVPFFEALDRLGLPLYLHPMNTTGREAMREFALEVLVGFPAETTLAITRMVFSGLMERFPHFDVILAHMGGTVPFLCERIDYGFTDFPECRRHIPKPPSEYFRGFYYDTALSYGRPTVRCVAEFAGPGHILFGTDYPFGMEKKLHCLTVEGVERSGLSPEDREKVYWGTAQGVLKIPS
ncbi:MAG: amidohydrolase [Candidatus Tectomicrobia bacterium]|nr:amidohydrolase [Candidatus Tectomicrobia bacterium]